MQPCTTSGYAGKAIFVALILFGMACSPKRLVIHAAADMVSAGGSAFGDEDDLELLLDALPFSLLTLESLAESAPDHMGVHQTLAGGFVQYAYAAADLKAELVKYESFEQFRKYQELARKRYLRGRDWGLKGLSIDHLEFSNRLRNDPQATASECDVKDIELLYWTGAGWLAAISMSIDRPDLLAQLPQAVALLDRAMVLKPDYGEGSLHELFIALDMYRGEAQGGGEAKAIQHYEKALELSKSQRASVFLAYATSIARSKQNVKLYVDYLNRALAVDLNEAPNNRLANLVSQEKARYLRNHLADLFDEVPEGF